MPRLYCFPSASFDHCSSEKKIDLIDRRLDGVVRLLEELKTRLPVPAPSQSQLPTRPATTPASNTLASASPASHGSHGNHSTEATSTVVEGESSLTAHSVFANDLLQKVVSRDVRPEMQERVEALRHMVEAMKKQPADHEMTYPNAKPIRSVAPEGCDLPPIGKTLEALKLAKCGCLS